MPQNSKANTKRILNQEFFTAKQTTEDNYAEIERNLSSISSYFKIPKLLRELKKSKSKGFTASNLFYGLIFSIFWNINSIFALSKKDFFLTESEKKNENNAKKDTYYRFINNEKNNWRKIQSLYVETFTTVVNENVVTDSEKKLMLPKCLIVDDSVLPKTGEKIEHIGKVHDHTTQKHILGYKYLCLGLYDGKSFIPIDFTLQGEAGKKGQYGLTKKKLEKRYSKKRDKKSPGGIRESEFFIDKISNTVTMLRNAIKQGVDAEYLLVDSWFFCEKLINESTKLELKIIGQWKINNQQVLLPDGKSYNLKTLASKCERNSKNAKYSKKFKSKYFEFIVEFKGIKLKIFVTKFKKNKKWRVVATSNLCLNFNTAIKYYSIRWSIEVYFKETKQLLNLGKNQSNCFDAQIAMTTVANLQYIMLALYKRFNAYETIGGMFKEAKDYISEMAIAERIMDLLFDILNFIFEILELDSENIEKLIRRILQDEKSGKKIIDMMEYDKSRKNSKQAC